MDGMKKKNRNADPIPKPDVSKPFFRELSIEFLIHELKDPISVIETGVRILLEKKDKYGPLSEKQEKTLKRVLRNSRKTRAMLYDLLEVGRSEAGQCSCCRFDPETVACEVMMESLESMVSLSPWDDTDCLPTPEASAFLEKWGVFFQSDVTSARLTLNQDETKFRRILGNLIKNALHHRKTRVDVRLNSMAGQLVVTVCDDGPGVDPKHHSAVFKRYAQLQAGAESPRKGHGLGLAGALIMARRLGGNIEIGSHPGQGAVFVFTLPLCYEETESSGPA